MPIFAVIGLGDPRLDAKVREQFPDDHYPLAPDNWFVVAPGITAAGVATKLGMDPKAEQAEKITGIVLTVGGYYGLAQSDVWEWLKAKGTPAGA